MLSDKFLEVVHGVLASGGYRHLSNANCVIQMLLAEVEWRNEESDNLRANAPSIEFEAFKAGYHCRWHKEQGSYCFDPAMSPGDPEGAFEAWTDWRGVVR